MTDATPVSPTPAPTTTVIALPAIEDKAKRVFRTLIQVGIPAFLALSLLLPQIIAALGLPVSSKLETILVGLSAGVTLVAGAITRLMLIPQVNAWLAKLKLDATTLTGLPVLESTTPEASTD